MSMVRHSPYRIVGLENHSMSPALPYGNSICLDEKRKNVLETLPDVDPKKNDRKCQRG